MLALTLNYQHRVRE